MPNVNDTIYRTNNGKTVAYAISAVLTDGTIFARLLGTSGELSALRFDLRRLKADGANCWTVNR